MYCPKCGASNRDDDEVCRKCGYSLKKEKNSSRFSNWKIGWMIFWRAILPWYIILNALLLSFGANYFPYGIVFLPIFIVLLDWAGKVVVVKKYDPKIITLHTFPVPFTTTSVSISNIGIGIFLRMILFNFIIFFPIFLISILLPSSINILISLILLPFLQIYIAGWITNNLVRKLLNEK